MSVHQLAANSAWKQPTEPDIDRSIESLVREWKIVGAKLKYDLAIADGSDETTNRLCGDAEKRQSEIEGEITSRYTTDPEELQLILGLAMKKLRQFGHVVDQQADMALLETIHGSLSRMIFAAEKAEAAS